MAAIEWVVTSYLIIICALILNFGRLGDIKGKTKVFTFGILLFSLGSLMCGFSSSLISLVAARVIRAVGASGTMATSQGIITQVFPNNERGRALGLVGTFVALGTMVGPPLGGFIVSAFSWEYIFLINVPIGIITFIMALKILPKTKKTVNEKLDLKGSFLFIVFVVLLFGCITQGQNIGYTNLYIISGLIISIAAFVLFVWAEKEILNLYLIYLYSGMGCFL